MREGRSEGGIEGWKECERGEGVRVREGVRERGGGRE